MSAPDPIAVQLRAARQHRGLSLEAFEHKFGIKAVVVGSWERGDRQPAISRLREWCEALDHQLVALGPAEDAAGNVWLEYAVQYDLPEGGTDLIECDSAGEAEQLAPLVTGGRVLCRRLRATDWADPEDGA